MENKAKLAVVEADLISEEKQEEGMTLPSKTKKNKNNKVFEVLNFLFASLTFWLFSCKKVCLHDATEKFNEHV